MTGMHQDEGASTVGVLDIPFLKTALPEKRRLLIACRARDPDRCIEEIGGFSVDTAGRFYLGKHGFGNVKKLQQLVIPLFFMNVEKHGSGGVGVIGDMYGALGQVPDEPGIDGSKEQFALLCACPCPFHMVENPGNLAGGKIGVGDQTGLFLDLLAVSFLQQIVDEIRRSSALPDDRRVNGLARLFIPDDRGFPLIGDANGGNIRRSGTNLRHRLDGNG